MKLTLLAATALAIATLVPLAPSSAAAQDEPIAELQALLAGRGCDVGSADGQWGRRTQAAADAFAREAGIPIARPITAELLAALAASNAQCPTPVLYNVEETLTPAQYWAFWANTPKCEPDASFRRSGPQEDHRQTTLPEALPADFGWKLEMPEGLALACGQVGGSLDEVPPRDVEETRLDYFTEYPAKIFARSLTGVFTLVLAAKGTDREAEANRSLVDYLLRASDARSVTKGNRVNAGKLPNLTYSSMTYFFAASVAFAYVAPVMTEDEKARVYAWIAPMVEVISNSRWGDAVDNKAAYRASVEAVWGYIANDRALIRKAQDSYRFSIRYMRPDGTFARDASRGGAGAHYSSIHMADLLTIAALDAMAGGDLFDYEVDGRSIHDAVDFYLDFGEDRVGTNNRYAKACDGSSTGSFEEPERDLWMVNMNRGGEGFAAIRLYALFNPDHPNTARLRKLMPVMDSKSNTWDMHHGALMCMVGSPGRATTIAPPKG